METIVNTLGPFFENPNRDFYLREISRELKTNHTTVRKRLSKLLKENYIGHIPQKPFPKYRAIISRKFLNLKLFYNLEKIRRSKIIEEIEKILDFPTVVLFGSYSKAEDDERSDIDLFILSESNKEVKVEKFETLLNRKVELFVYDRKQFSKLKGRNPELINSIINGVVLSGQFEVI
tara:strand:- start:418 stop:948 length:531 start_codon:yes stop_codon:yes gene_type:complete